MADLSLSDLLIATGRAALPADQRGGQHVGTCGAVRIEHKPTGTEVFVPGRNFHANKERAMAAMKVALGLAVAVEPTKEQPTEDEIDAMADDGRLGAWHERAIEHLKFGDAKEDTSR